MSHLALMVRRASTNVAQRVSMEQLLEAAETDNLSMEQLFCHGKAVIDENIIADNLAD